MAQVVQRWGHNYRICAEEPGQEQTDTVWYYIYGRGEPLGAAVRFNKAGKVTAVFTLGSPPGWRTTEGVLVGGAIDDVTRLYGNLSWSVCIGYGAMSMRNAKAVTSIYTTRRGDLRLRDHRARHPHLPVAHAGRGQAVGTGMLCASDRIGERAARSSGPARTGSELIA